MMRYSRVWALTAAGLQLACGAPAGEVADAGAAPCAPHGELHTGSNPHCHCAPGYRAEGLACVESEGTPDAGFDFGDEGEHACLHAVEGPFADVAAVPGEEPRVDAFETFHRLTLQEEVEGHRGVFSFRPWASGDFVLTLSERVPLTLRAGEQQVPVLEEGDVSACRQLRHRVGVRLQGDVTYLLQLGPTPQAQLGLFIGEEP
jgi:hypothetical protein